MTITDNHKSEGLPTYTIPGEKKFLKKELTAFLILSTIISWSVMLFVIARLPSDFKPGDSEAVKNAFGNFPMLFGTGPFIAAVIVTLICRGKIGLGALFSKVVTWKVPLQWYLWALILPVIPQWIGLWLWKQLTGTELMLPALTDYLSSWIQIALISAAYYITEELGWRGFMLPRMLSMFTWIKSSLLVGIFWSVWHYPLWFTSNWGTTGSLQEAALMLAANTIFTIGATIMLTVIFKHTKGSILFAMLFHGSSQANLTKMYTAAGDSSLTGSSFILVVAATLCTAAILLLIIIRSQDKRLSKSPVLR